MKGKDTPLLACTLEFSEMGSRLARLRHLAETSLDSHEQRGNVLHLVYRPEAAGEVMAIVALERDCCRFLDFDVHEGPSGLAVTITAPSRLDDATAWLFGQFLPTKPPAETARRPCCPSCT